MRPPGNEAGSDRRASIPWCGPTSLVAAEIHLGRKPAGICDGWLHRNIQVACHPGSYKLSSFINRLKNSERNLAAFAAADFEQLA
jgi:hypothetical protein